MQKNKVFRSFFNSRTFFLFKELKKEFLIPVKKNLRELEIPRVLLSIFGRNLK